MTRKAILKRETSEVRASVELDLDGTGKFDISTGVPFFDHMLSQFAKHGYFDLTVRAEGDINVDFHHTVEDVGSPNGGVLPGKPYGSNKCSKNIEKSLAPYNGKKKKDCNGSLQKKKVRETICAIMGGESKAFKDRYRRIAPEKYHV